MAGAAEDLEELVRRQGPEGRQVVVGARGARFLPPGCRWSCLVNLTMLGVQVTSVQGLVVSIDGIKPRVNVQYLSAILCAGGASQGEVQPHPAGPPSPLHPAPLHPLTSALLPPCAPSLIIRDQ